MSTVAYEGHDNVVLNECLWSKSTGEWIVDPPMPGVIAVEIGRFGDTRISDSPVVFVPVVVAFADSLRAARARLTTGVRAVRDGWPGEHALTDRGEEGTVAWAIVGAPFVQPAFHLTSAKAERMRAGVARQATDAVDLCLKAARDAAQHPTASREWAITDLGTLGGKSSSAAAINDRGEIVGSSTTSTGATHAFLWRDGRMRDLGISPRGFNSTRAVAINQKGQIVGVSEKFAVAVDDLVTVKSLIWLWKDGVVTTIASFPGGLTSIRTGPWDMKQGIAINDGGQVAVTAGSRPFLWQDGKTVELPLDTAVAINAQGQIIGTKGEHAVVWQRGKTQSQARKLAPVAINDKGQVIAFDSAATHDWHSFLWTHGKLADVDSLGGGATSAASITEQGEVVGWSSTVASRPGAIVTHAFLWREGAIRDLGTLGGRSSAATAINDHGQIIGYSDTKYANAHAFVWEQGKIKELSGLGGVERTAVAINNRGQIIGSGTTKNGTEHAVLWSIRSADPNAARPTLH